MSEKPERCLLSVKEASAWMGIPVFTLYTWAQASKIPYYKIEKRVLMAKRTSRSGWISIVEAQRVRISL